MRYSLLKHYYSIFVIKRGFGTIFKPMFFDFPLDNNNYFDEIANSQFMIGPDLMAAPMIEEGKTSRKVYFTTIPWYDFYTGAQYQPGTH